MARFTVFAHQEMYAQEEIESDTLSEAIDTFRDRLMSGRIVWRPSDETMDFSVSEEDEAGNIIREIDGDSLDISLAA